MNTSNTSFPLRSWAARATFGLSIFALSACGATAQQHGGANAEAQLPIKRVVLYQNGIGYFERQGKLKGNLLTLQIRPSQINDLLKSLTVIDRNEGRAMSVSLPLEKTSAQILSELPEQVRGAGGLLDVLRVFRGARVTIEGSEGSAKGRVVGVEPMETLSGESVLKDWRLTLKSNGSLKVYPVSAITRISIKDRTLTRGLDQSLDVSLNEGNWKPISLSVRLAGNPNHDLQVSYIVEMPLWKPAYRLVMSDDGQPLLQGWAVVDNVSGEDWNDVQLSLVAGTPMSFIYDLHSPQFMGRMDLTPNTNRKAMAPAIERSGVETAKVSTKDLLNSSYAKKRSASGASASGRRPRSAPAPVVRESKDDYDKEADEIEEDLSQALEQQVVASAGGEHVGALFRYDLKHPVTVPDRSSTLVSIINERVSGKEVVYFRPELIRGSQQVHPYRAVMFKNNTGFSLERGPVSIFSSGTFVGEGFLDRMEKNNTTFLTYSIDGNVAMSPRTQGSQEGMKLLKIIDGMIVSEVLEVSSSIYKVENRHAEPVVAYVKTMKRAGWALRTKPAGTVELPDAFVVPVNVTAGGTEELKVDWVKPMVRSVAIDTNLSTTVLTLYLRNGKAPKDVQAKIDQILKIKVRIGEIDEDSGRFNKQHYDATRDQNRVRSNLNLLRKSPGNKALRSELTKKLAALEASLGKLSGKIVKLSEEKANLTRQMKTIIRQITILGS